MLPGVLDRLVGQERATEALRRAAERPVHAYLIVGPAGSGADEAARALAAQLIDAARDPRAADLIARGVHPDVIEFEPEGVQYRVREDVRERIIPEASRAPIEADRKVLIVHEAERLHGNQHEPANALLKTLEEPPPRTILVLVTSQPEDLLETIRSRCQRVDLDPVSVEALERALIADGAEAGTAALAARLSGGQLARARALAGPLAELRAAFASVPARVDGTGATAARLASEMDEVIGASTASMTAGHERELVEFDSEMERHGYEGRAADRLRRRLVRRHEREARRARMSLLLEGVTAVESVYRDVLAPPGGALNTDVSVRALSPRACAGALDECRTAREAFLVQEKGLVRLQHLFLSLPPSGSSGSAREPLG
jgi:DNA polymerase-3 subunit delta'